MGIGRGIGGFLAEGREQFRMDVVLLGVLVIALIGYAINLACGRCSAGCCTGKEMHDEPTSHSGELCQPAYSRRQQDLSGRRPAVVRAGRNIALDIEPGEFVSVVGASGRGKSTLLRLIIGLDTEYEWRRPAAGWQARSKDPGRSARSYSRRPRLFPWLTVADNIALGLDAIGTPPSDTRDRSVAENIALVGLTGSERPIRISCPAAWRNARRSRGRWSTGRRFCCSTNRSTAPLDSLTRAYRKGVAEDLAAGAGHRDHGHARCRGSRLPQRQSGGDGARPGRIGSIIPIELDHPRDRASPEFIARKEQILRELQHLICRFRHRNRLSLRRYPTPDIHRHCGRWGYSVENGPEIRSRCSSVRSAGPR